VFVLYAAVAAVWMLWVNRDADTVIRKVVVHDPPPPVGRAQSSSPWAEASLRPSLLTGVVLAGGALAAMAVLVLVLRPRVGRQSVGEKKRMDRDGDRVEAFDPTKIVGGDDDGNQGIAPSSDGSSKEIKRQLGQLDAVLEIGIIIIGTNGKPRFVGDRAVEQLDISGADVTYDELSRRIRPLLDDINEVARSCGMRKRTLEISGKKGARELEVTICALQASTTPEVMLLLRDLEHLPAIEQSLIEATRLRALARISLGVAHDLRAPMNAIALTLANFKDTLLADGELVGEEHAETVEMLEEELHRLQRSLELLLGQTSPWSTESEVFFLGELLEEVELLMQAQARQQHIALRLEVPPVGLRVRGHPDRIKQAVVNLVVNAFDATTQGGVVIALERIGGDARITVTDSGSGIPDAILDHMFTTPGSSKKTGLGIGLMAARSAVEAAGGSLDLRRTGADGTSFEIRLPLAEGGNGGARA